MPKKLPDSPTADATAPVPEVLGEPFFIPSLGITVVAPSLEEAVAMAGKLRS